MKLQWSRFALADLMRLQRYLATDDATLATATVRRLRTAARHLQEFPNLGTEMGRPGEYPVRQLLVGDYALWYEGQPSDVVILRVWHTRQQHLPGSLDLG